MAPPFTILSSSSVASTSAAPLPRAVPLWAEEYQTRYTTVVNSDGDFNGTCTMTGESIPLLLDDNLCASWFQDITTFCCGAVGGILEQATQNNTSTVNDTLSNDAASFEPVCETTNYSDMLDCYMVTSIDSCSSTDVAPWGICNAKQLDTSRTGGQSNGVRATRCNPTSLSLLLLLLLPFLSIVVG